MEKQYTLTQDTKNTDIVKNLRENGMIAESEFEEIEKNGP